MLNLRIMVSDDWMDFAACKGVPVDVFFCDEEDKISVEFAKEICDQCPVVHPCYEMSLGIQHGIWAGMTARERKKERLRR